MIPSAGLAHEHMTTDNEGGTPCPDTDRGTEGGRPATPPSSAHVARHSICLKRQIRTAASTPQCRVLGRSGRGADQSGILVHSSPEPASHVLLAFFSEPQL